VRCSIELTISYVYLALHSYADRDNVGLPGFAAWFKDESDGERDHAQLLLNFQVRCPSDVPQVSVPVWPGCKGNCSCTALGRSRIASNLQHSLRLQNKRGGRVKLHTLVAPEME
jgi:Ferritin-like domain